MAWLTSKIYAIGGLILAVFLGIGAAFLTGRSSAKNEIKAKGEKLAREIDKVGYEAADAGRIREMAIRKEKIDTKKRDHFE